MTHTLHRRGTRDSLAKDFVFLSMPSKGINDSGSAPKLAEFMRIGLEQGCIKIGDASFGNEYTQGGIDKVLENVKEMDTVHAVFDDKQKAINMIRALKYRDLGLSVVVSGLVDEVDDCCKSAGLQRHTVEYSMGIWGRTDKLPSEAVLEFNTMCGHGMVSVGLINKVIDKVVAKKITPKEGAEQLFKPCTCGIFNTSRAADLLQKILDSHS